MLFDGVGGPDDFAGFGVEAVELSDGTEGVGFALVDGDGGAWACVVCEVAVVGGVGVFPDEFAGFEVVAEDAFDFDRVELSVHGVDAVVGGGDTGVSATDGVFPVGFELFRPVVGEFGELVGAVTKWAAPARPILGVEGGG